MLAGSVRLARVQKIGTSGKILGKLRFTRRETLTTTGSEFGVVIASIALDLIIRNSPDVDGRHPQGYSDGMLAARQYISLLLGLVFISGIVAPVPECYMTKLICPLQKGLAAPCPISKAASRSCASTPSCPMTRHQTGNHSPLPGFGLWIKPYTPDIETAEVPVVLPLLGSHLFPEPPDPGTRLSSSDTNQQNDPPDHIPILLNKQSFLI